MYNPFQKEIDRTPGQLINLTVRDVTGTVERVTTRNNGEMRRIIDSNDSASTKANEFRSNN